MLASLFRPDGNKSAGGLQQENVGKETGRARARRSTKNLTRSTLPASIIGDAAATGFLAGLDVLGFEHARFRTAAATALLAAQFFDLIALGGSLGDFALLEFTEEEFAGEEAVHALLARFLAFHLQAGGPMDEHHTGGSLVHVLPAVAAGADERFHDVTLRHAQRLHALGKLVLFLFRDGIRAHLGGRYPRGRGFSNY